MLLHKMKLLPAAAITLSLATPLASSAQQSAPAKPPIILHAAHLLDVVHGTVVTPGEVLIEGERIREAGPHVTHPAHAQLIDLGQTTLMPGLIDAHVHLFLHPGNEAFQTVEESVPERTLIAAAAAKADLLAGFTAERDMGTEGAGCADVAVRNAINRGLIPGPRMRMSCNAIDINGGHEDTSGLNPEEHLLSNADRANTADEIIAVMREQHKQGADFTKIYETGRDHEENGEFVTPYQYTEAQLAAAVAEAHRTGSRVGVHCTGEPGASYAVAAGVASIDHAYQLSPETMRAMREKQIYAVPTFQIAEYFADHAASPAAEARERQLIGYHEDQFKKQLAAGVPMAVGSDVGPSPHGTQAHEYELMVHLGMSPADTLKAGLLNGAKLLDWANDIGQLSPNFYADIIAVPGNPLENISVLLKPSFVMKNGDVFLNSNPH
jgi:imidazolonepropionase-like amidohydrolase